MCRIHISTPSRRNSASNTPQKSQNWRTTSYLQHPRPRRKNKVDLLPRRRTKKNTRKELIQESPFLRHFWCVLHKCTLINAHVQQSQTTYQKKIIGKKMPLSSYSFALELGGEWKKRFPCQSQSNPKRRCGLRHTCGSAPPPPAAPPAAAAGTSAPRGR